VKQIGLALCVNPMSGRDVRRIAGRASNMTHEAKRDIVARVAAGADAVGVTDIYVTREPFRIASLALAHMELSARVHVLDLPIANDATDTERAVEAFRAAGCTTFVSIGGDGTNRAITRAASDIELVALSTGTNNVFPQLLEPTVAGMVAGLAAAGRLPRDALTARAKVLRVCFSDGGDDVGLVDAVLLKNDFVGNLLPFDADRLGRLLLTRAEPDAIGMSPIGGFVDPVDAGDDCGLLLEMGPGQSFLAPLSPGLFRRVSVTSHVRVPLGMPVVFHGPGVLALDGDRDHKLQGVRTATITIARDGPWVFDVRAAMRYAVTQGIIGPPLSRPTR
jgi:ATP-NAD kinase N-terminal domain